ncbi:MAG: hypothetical protein ACF8GE_02510 [Phycisphaerales bacterium JB043]
MDASFEEKSVWITLLGLLIGFGIYFVLAGRMLSDGVMSVPSYIPLFVGATVVLVLVLIGGHVMAALARKPEDADERDRLIAWRAENNSSWILGVGVLLAIGALAAQVEAAWVANGLLAFLFLSEVVKLVLQISYYRRGL